MLIDKLQPIINFIALINLSLYLALDIVLRIELVAMTSGLRSKFYALLFLQCFGFFGLKQK